MRTLAVAALLLLGHAAAALAQTVFTGVSRDTIRVGDPFRVLLRIAGLPSGAEVQLPDSLPPLEDVENAGPLRMRRDSAATDNRITAAYSIVVWRPGTVALPSVPLVIRAAGSERVQEIVLPTINVVSVLPADTTNIQAKPPKDVWGANRLWWPWLIAAALLLLIAAALWWWWRRRRRAQPAAAVTPSVDPRERALQELQRIRELQLVERGQFKQHYILLSEALRAFAAALETDWSTDLTTEELAVRLKRRPEASPLLRLLRSADMVKFARRLPAASEAHADMQLAEEWIRSFERRAEMPEAA